ncbi:syntaxin-like protein [Nannochloropsis gaditana]|nr:syntaxin-like protein [Nannochloropsis gaditana]
MLALAQERELAIREVTSHLVELKDVFSDFAELVQGQQEGVDAVCRNVEVAHAKTEQGYEAILKANEGQRAETGGCVLS